VERTGETWTQGKGRKGKEAGRSGVGNEVERTGENWTQGKGRKGKEAEGNTREQGRRDPWRNLYRTVERTGENWTQGKGRKGKEAENAKGGETPLEKKMSEVERTGENWTQGRGRKGKEAERDEAERTGENWTQGRGRKGKEAEESTRGSPGLRARGTPGPCGVCRGGSSPMCGTPCCSHLYRQVRHRPT
jgi:hypothetical protein